MKPSLALQFLSTAFTAAVAASSSSASAAEELAKKYDKIHRDIDGAAAAAAATSRASRNLDSIHTTTTSKSSKSSSYCPPKPTQDVQCGNTYVNSTVILGQNLICIEGRDGVEAVLMLKGKKALLDCQGYTISQKTNSSAAAMDGTEDLFYLRGVKLERGARMVNCNIQKFYLGVGMKNGGGIEDSQFSLNLRGAEIDHFGGDAANTVSKVVNR